MMRWRVRWRYRDERHCTYWASFIGPPKKRAAAQAFRAANPLYAVVEIIPEA